MSARGTGLPARRGGGPRGAARAHPSPSQEGTSDREEDAEPPPGGAPSAVHLQEPRTVASYTPAVRVQGQRRPPGGGGAAQPGEIPPAATRGGRGRGAASLRGATHAPRAPCSLKHTMLVLEPDHLGSNPITHVPVVSSWASDFASPRLSFLKGKTGVMRTGPMSKGWVRTECANPCRALKS